ncbi:glycoside hydrolase superfamily [Crepidotus variabilis]|uniref:Glycoside hydrolase superfamily n=1 Tax=Crepidotus variabilis TaxID=179855 RepID=A0A9P6JSB0_9AGAR|nr:glycoside hydrolase superfamily [Crepidotus variabilis]
MRSNLGGRRLSWLLMALATTLLVEATQVMHRPDRYKEKPNSFPMETNVKINTIQRRALQAGGKVSMAYFTSWGIYGPNFQPTDIISSTLTHVLYSFADIDSTTNTIKLTDSYADETKMFPGDSSSEPGHNLYGNLKQLYLIKMKQRNFKVLLSIGGWTNSQAGHFNFVTNPSARTAFVNSAVQMIEDYGFDGIDLDWEYPTSKEQGQGFADLFTALRTAFNNLQTRKSDSTRYIISSAMSLVPSNYQLLNIPQLNAAIDYWNFMAYDFSGPWSTTTENQANVYGGQGTGLSSDAAVTGFKSLGASVDKIVLGMPLYGRGFDNTNGLHQPYSGGGPGTIDPGVYSYKALPFVGSQIYENSTDISSYSYDAAKKEFITYDTPNIVKMKANYIKSKGLAGSMFWELSTDKVGSASLVGTVASNLGGLDQTLNHLYFPNSKWDNIRNNMGQGTPSPTNSPPPTSSSSTPAPTPTAGKCTGISAWDASTVYTTNMQVTYGGDLWIASWWNQNMVPGGPAVAWKDNGPC